MNISVAENIFNVMLDTGSSDLLVPSKQINSYSGPKLNITLPSSTPLYLGRFGDGATYEGFSQRLLVSLPGTNITANGNVMLLYKQSLNPTVIDNIAQGLMGLAYSNISKLKPNIVDEWSSNNQIKNQIGFHACPYEFPRDSWIDFGNAEGYNNCGFNGPV
jgi:hypothetical protein